ncbi:MAG: MOP flippase family protein [Prochlorotrichaceae cyanobacterium]|jgi:PST family polysaccharide transporter
MSLQQKAIKGVVWTALQNWGSQVLFFITFLILARVLGPAAFGLVSMANVFIHFVQALLGQSFADAIVQRKDLEPEHLDTAFWINLAIGLTLFLIGMISAPWIALGFKQLELTAIIRWLSFSVVLNALSSTHQAILRRDLNFKSLAVRQLTGQSVGSIVAIVMSFSGFGVWSIVSQQLLSNLVGTALLWKITAWRPQFRVSRSHFQDLFDFGINVVGMNILVFISLRSDDLLIGYYLGPVALGYYSVAYRLLVTVTQLLTDTIRQIVLPTFARLQDDLDKMRQAFYTATELVSFVALPAFLGMAILAPELVLALFGEQWSNSIPVMQILAVVGLLRSFFNFSGAVMMSLGKPSWNLGIMTLDTIAKVIAFRIGVEWGIITVALGLLIVTISATPLRLWVLQKLLKFNLLTYLGRYTHPFLSSGLMMIAIYGSKRVLQGQLDPKVLLGIYIVIGTVTYFLSLWTIAPHFLKKLQKNVMMIKSPAK